MSHILKMICVFLIFLAANSAFAEFNQIIGNCNFVGSDNTNHLRLLYTFLAQYPQPTNGQDRFEIDIFNNQGALMQRHQVWPMNSKELQSNDRMYTLKFSNMVQTSDGTYSADGFYSEEAPFVGATYKLNCTGLVLWRLKKN